MNDRIDMDLGGNVGSPQSAAKTEAQGTALVLIREAFELVGRTHTWSESTAMRDKLGEWLERNEGEDDGVPALFTSGYIAAAAECLPPTAISLVTDEAVAKAWERTQAVRAEVHAPSESPPAPEWGEPIAVDGKRPEWLRDDEPAECLVARFEEFGWGNLNAARAIWPDLASIRLAASHPYYLATSRGFTYWPGGEKGPSDWDGGEVLMLYSVPTLDGEPDCRPLNMEDCQDLEASGWNWPSNGDENYGPSGFIGYRRKPEEEAEPCTCSEEWDEACPVHLLPPTMPENAFVNAPTVTLSSLTDGIEARETKRARDRMREDYAGKALQGLLAFPGDGEVMRVQAEHCSHYARLAFAYADEMVAEAERWRKGVA